MRKRMLILLTLICAALPMAAGAATTAWQLTAKVNNPGGSLAVRGGAPTTGTFFKIYTTAQSVPVVITANSGYGISSVAVNGGAITPVPGSPATYQMGLSAYPGKSSQVVSVYFAKQLYPVTATAGVGGVVSPSGTANLGFGASASYTFTPNKGNQVIDITGLPVGATLTDTVTAAAATLPAPVDHPVRVAFTVSASSVSMSGVFVSITANAGVPQTVMNGATVTLNGSATPSAGATYAWTQTGGPVVTLSDATAQAPAFSAVVNGTYNFRLTASNGTATATATTYVVVSSSAAAAARSQCQICHQQNGVGAVANVFALWSSSGHNNASAPNLCAGCHVGANTGAHPGAAFSQIPNICISCHAGVGATSTQYANWNKSSHNYANNGFEQVGCNSCHNEHSTVASATDDRTDSCSVCHNDMRAVYGPTANFSIYTSTSKLVMKTPHGQGVPAYMGGSGGASDNATAGWPTAQSSYMTRGAICTDCHGHDNTVNAGFAEGGHGKVSNDSMNAFNHYDWSKQTNNGTRQNGNCDRCHTAGGFMKLLGATGDPAYSRLNAGLAPFASYTSHNINKYQANSILICIGCHKTAEGALRTDAQPAGNPTPLTGGYFALFSTSKSYGTSGIGATIGAAELDKTKIQLQFPGYKNSSICVPCHSGRSTADVFKTVIARANADFKNFSTVPTSYYQHAANMGQTFIGKGAYDFTGTLATIGAGTHANVKMSVSTEKGPCVGCHYSDDTKTHSLEVKISDVNCSTSGCHASGFSAASFGVEEENFNAGVKALDELIRAKFDGLRIDTTKPLETERANVRFGRFMKTAGVDADAATAEKAYGAWYNWQLLTAWDKAAFVHNTNYARKIVADTIDYLDDGTVGNASVQNTILASTTLTTTEKAAAADFVAGGSAKIWDKHVDPSSNTYKVQYTLTGSTGSSPVTCATCHYAGGETAVQAEARKAWAESGHGETTALPWQPASSHLWRNAGSTVNFQTNIPKNDCVRCHTPEGAAQFFTSGLTNINAVASSATAATGSPLSCNACHVNGLNATSQRLAVAQVTTYYNISSAGVKGRAAATFPDTGDSNLCFPCHAGRVSGSALEAAAPQMNFANTSFQNSHYMAAAGIMYMKGGFTAFADPATAAPYSVGKTAYTYGDSYTMYYGSGTTPAGQISSTHRKFGTSLMSTDTHGLTTLTSNGPCVACHMKASYTGASPADRPGAGHSLAIDQNAAQQLCVKCHSAEMGADGSLIETFLEENSADFQLALTIAKNLLYQNKGVGYNSASYPYFYVGAYNPSYVESGSCSANAAVKNWQDGAVETYNYDTTKTPPVCVSTSTGSLTPHGAYNAGTAGTGLKNMGAAFNINILSRDPGAYAHARKYAQRLLYDTIDYLDDNTINQSVVATITGLGYNPGTSSYNAAGAPKPTDMDRIFDYLFTWDGKANGYNGAWIRRQ